MVDFLTSLGYFSNPHFSFLNYRDLMFVTRQVLSGQRPEVPTSCGPAYRELIMMGWSADGAARPTAEGESKHRHGFIQKNDTS
jgi:hypothetical protein